MHSVVKTPAIDKPAPAIADDAETDLHTPMILDVLIERMACLRARLAELATRAASEQERKAFEDAQWAIHGARFKFNPYDSKAVLAMDRRVDRWFEEVNAGRAPVVTLDE